MTGRYPLSKLLVVFGVRALADQLAQSKAPLVIINTPNPSFCKSQLARETDNVGLRVSEKLLARSTEEGSRALVHGIMADERSNGQYLTNCRVHRSVGCWCQVGEDCTGRGILFLRSCCPSFVDILGTMLHFGGLSS